MTTMSTPGSRKLWYGNFSVRAGDTAFWQVGPYQLWAHRSVHEWRLASVRGTDSLDGSLVVDVPSDREEPPEGAQIRRVAFQRAPDSLTLTPTLADRPLVASPEEPLQLPPNEQITLYISTPVWVELTTGEPAVILADEPTHRPTDTWFGPSSMRGELCYATRTAARMVLENIPPRPHRVISVVEIKNSAKTVLTVERLKIPTPHLSVYATRSGDLWTEALTLEHHEEAEMAAVRLAKGPPRDMTDAALIRGPRTPMGAGILTRAFGGLLR